MKRKNDYYYIIKLGIFQRKSEETRHHFPNGTLLPGEMLLSEKCHTDTSSFVQLAKDGFGFLKKKKKSFMIFV